MWAKALLAKSVLLPPTLHGVPPLTLATFLLLRLLLQVRVVQHKQTRELYALKYINKAKCVKMKAVANIIQERRLLEEVSSLLGFV